MRHGLITEFDPRAGASVSSLAYEYPARYQIPDHAHDSDQVIYAPRGVMEVSVGQRFWLIPPQFAIWVPARTVHRIRMPAAVSMRTLYLRRGLAPGLPATCRVLHVGPLLRELIVEAVRIGQLRSRNRLHRTLRDLIVSQLQNAAPVPIFMTLPKDARALAVAQAVLTNQNRNFTFATLCADAGASVRTIERAFQRDVGLSFEAWRRQARLMKAIEILVAGRSVKEAAFEVGYQRSGTLVKVFRQTMGVTPKAWAAAQVNYR